MIVTIKLPLSELTYQQNNVGFAFGRLTALTSINGKNNTCYKKQESKKDGVLYFQSKVCSVVN